MATIAATSLGATAGRGGVTVVNKAPVAIKTAPAPRPVSVVLTGFLKGNQFWG